MFGFKQHRNSSAAICIHPHALPRWDNVEEAGDPTHVSRFYCADCDRFIPASELPKRSEGPANRSGAP